MIFLQQDSENPNCVFTLSELTTLTGTSPYYLFKFVSQDTLDETLFTGYDTSLDKIRYNQFNIILTGSSFVNYTASTINLTQNGFYHYYVYQQYSPTNISLSGITGDVIEYGKVLVSGSTTSVIAATYTGQTNNIFTYNG